MKTVGELINELQNIDKDMPVFVATAEWLSSPS